LDKKANIKLVQEKDEIYQVPD